MKILLTLDSNLMTDINGVVISVIRLANELKSRGEDVRVLMLGQRNQECNNPDYYILPSVSADFIYPSIRLRLLPIRGKLLREILEWGPDVVHSQNESCTFDSARVIAKKLNVPLIQTNHSDWEDLIGYLHVRGSAARKIVSMFLRQHISRHCSVWIAPSEKTRKVLKGYGITKPIEVVPTGTDIERFAAGLIDSERAALRASLNLPKDCKLALFAGRIAREKNTDEILDFFSHITDENTFLLFAGGGPYLEELKKKAAKSPAAERIHFTGMIAPREMPKYYAISDFFVSASVFETQGLTYTEALYSGLPLLCRADPCLTGVVRDGVNGFQYHNESEFSEYFEKLSMWAPDREGIRASVPREFTAEHFADTMLGVYRKAAEEHKNRKAAGR